MTPRRAPFTRTRRNLVLLGAVGILILAGCAKSNTPNQYNALTEANFTEGCTASGQGAPYCTCAYRVLSGPDGIPFSEFAKLDGQLAKNPDAMPDDIQAKVQSCSTPAGPTTIASSATGGTTA
jgi:hypothetical protein